MGGGEASSSSMQRGVDMVKGTETELLRIDRAQLVLIDGEESVRMAQGHFALIIMVQAQSPLAAMVAQVSDVQWPVGKDGPVLKLGNYRYTFAIPGLLYGLKFPSDTPKDLIRTFESLMQQFCTYEVRSDLAEIAGLSNLRLRYPPTTDDLATDGVEYWTAVAADVEQYSSTLALRIKKGSSMAATGISKGGEWASWGISQVAARAKSNFSSRAAKAGGGGGGSVEEMSPRMRRRVDQARRMSAVAKLLSRTVLKGAIRATDHVANLLGSTGAGVSRPLRGYLTSDAPREVAVASVDAFAKVAEAVETAGKSLATATISAGTDLVQQRYGEHAGRVAQEGLVAVGDMISSMWTLNKIGMSMLWGATASSIFLNTAAAANGNASAFRHTNRASSLMSSETSTNSFLSSTTFPAVSMSTSSLFRPSSSSSSMARTMSISSQSQLHQLLDDTGTSASPDRGQYSGRSPPNSNVREHEYALETVQLFPSTPALDADRDSSHPHSSTSAYIPTTTPVSIVNHHHLYMQQQLQQHPPPPLVSMLPAAGNAAAYNQPGTFNPNSPFQHYSGPA